MDFKIRNIQISDKDKIFQMMEEFYSSDAVSTNGSAEIFNTDFQNCISDFPYLEGFVFEKESEILGYSMISKSFSTEFGKLCIWLEDLYLKPQHRGFGVIPKFVEYMKKSYPDAILKLEVEEENKHAIHVYEKMGFSKSPYFQMKNI